MEREGGGRTGITGMEAVQVSTILTVLALEGGQGVVLVVKLLLGEPTCALLIWLRAKTGFRSSFLSLATSIVKS